MLYVSIGHKVDNYLKISKTKKLLKALIQSLKRLKSFSRGATKIFQNTKNIIFAFEYTTYLTVKFLLFKKFKSSSV